VSSVSQLRTLSSNGSDARCSSKHGGRRKELLAHFIDNLARPARGEVWWLGTKVGVRDGKNVLEPRPWLVVHGNQWARDVRWPEILVVRITSDVTRDRPTQIRLTGGEAFGGAVLCETLTAAPRWRFTRYGSAVSPATMTGVESALRVVLGMGEQ
jgi:mRNA-degrading endonuclease toxin of MazEF toxin-antitoxin module